MLLKLFGGMAVLTALAAGGLGTMYVVAPDCCPCPFSCNQAAQADTTSVPVAEAETCCYPGSPCCNPAQECCDTCCNPGSPCCNPPQECCTTSTARGPAGKETGSASGAKSAECCAK